MDEELKRALAEIESRLNNLPVETAVNVGLAILVKSVMCYKENRGVLSALLKMDTMCRLLKENVIANLQNHETEIN